MAYLVIALSPTGDIVQVQRFIPGSTKLWVASSESASTRYQMVCCDQAPQRPLTVTPWAFLLMRTSEPPASMVVDRQLKWDTKGATKTVQFR